MAGCNFIVSGENFDVSAFMLDSPWRSTAKVFFRGDKISSKRKQASSGFVLDISVDNVEGFDQQIIDLLNFSISSDIEINRVLAFPGVEKSEFKIGIFWYENTACYPLTIPTEFSMRMGKIGIPVTIYVYAASLL